MTVVSEEGRGRLTVADARYEDAGAYTCEAINNRGSIFAIPDALVIVRRKCKVVNRVTSTLPSYMYQICQNTLIGNRVSQRNLSVNVEVE